MILAATFLMLILAILCVPVALAEGTPKESVVIEESVHFQRNSGSVRGLVYQDWDEDGARDPEEPALAGATLALVIREGSRWGAPSPTTKGCIVSGTSGPANIS